MAQSEKPKGAGAGAPPPAETQSPPTETTEKTPTGEVKAFEVWAEQHKPEAWVLAAAIAHSNWPVGREITEADFLKALEEAKEVRL